MHISGYTCIENALKKIPNRNVPCFPLIDVAFASSFSGTTLYEIQTKPKAHARALALCAANLPVDGVYINLALGGRQADNNYRIGEKTFLVDDSITVVVPENDVLSISGTDIDNLGDSRIEKAELFHPGMLEAYNEIPSEIKKEYAVVTGLTGTFSQVAFLFGVQNLLLAILDSPSEATAALNRRHETVMRQVDELCDAGVKFAWIGEGLGSGSLISPEQYGDFVLPFEQDITRRFRERGVMTLLHICGNTGAALNYITRSGADGFDLDYPVPLETAIDILYPHMAIKGNINPVLFLPDRAAELEKACRAAVEKAGHLPGFILSTGCLIPRDSSGESFDIMRTESNIKKGAEHE